MTRKLSGVSVVATGPELERAAAEAERWGFSGVWVPGADLMEDLSAVERALAATERVPVSTAIISVDQYPREHVAEWYARVERAHPGRLLLGLGGAHGPRPLTTCAAYLDELDQHAPTVPAERRILAAMGPRMLDLAAERTAGALPVLVTPEYTARARERLGSSTLVVQQMAVVDGSADKARAAASGILEFLTSVPGYPENMRRMGFSDSDIGSLSNRLVDELVAWGEPAAVAARVAEQQQAGADQVAVMTLPGEGIPGVVEQLRLLAEELDLSAAG